MASEDLAQFLARAESWLEQQLPRRADRSTLRWGEGSDDVALFKNLTASEERAHIDALRQWQQKKSEAGFGSIDWPTKYGGASLSAAHAHGFASLERRFQTPAGHEAVSITLDLVAPTILTCGNDDQRERYVRSMRRTDDMWCQLFSEPGAGSDLASVTTRAERAGDHWTLNGQKVWTSGAQYADFGYILCRTDATAPRHAGLTAFIIPMDADGVDVRPLRQMSGGSSFNEVFLTDVELPDSFRLGEVGAGWSVALTTLGFERASATSSGTPSDEIFDRLVLAARHNGKDTDPLTRQALARIYTDGRVRTMTRRRVTEAAKAGGVPGPEGSLDKLAWTEGLRQTVQAVSSLLGMELIADSGTWGTYAWSEFVNGVSGFRVAGGSDEIQRNIIAERVLGLPREPRP
ncbi:MAG TPA: acyl-CoA dehydrogenase family protein [Acidimicrobiales bacterium]